MSVVPFLRMMRLMDQEFRTALNRHEYLASSFLREAFHSPWEKEISVKDISSSVTTDKDKFQVSIIYILYILNVTKIHLANYMFINSKGNIRRPAI